MSTEDTSGDYLFESRAVHDSFFIRGAENLRYCFSLEEYVKDSYDHTLWGDNIELTYESAVCGGGAIHLLFCFMCQTNNTELLYCNHCIGCNHCCGCICLHQKKYCILNKQYTQEEYEKLVPKFIEHMQKTGEWGDMFPMSMSAVPYNRSLAQRYFPLTKEQAAAKGLKWYDKEPVSAEGALEGTQLPDGLPQSDDSITVKSALSGRPFLITSREIERCRAMHVPLARATYDERMEERAKKLGGIRLYDRVCAKTGKKLQTTIPPDSSWIIWDKDVYEKEFGS